MSLVAHHLDVSKIEFFQVLLPEENNNKYSKLISYQGHYYASFDIQTLSNSKICLWDTKDVNLDYVHSISYPFQFIHTLYLHLSQKNKQGIHFLQRGLLVKTSIHTTFKWIKSNSLLLSFVYECLPIDHISDFYDWFIRFE